MFWILTLLKVCVFCVSNMLCCDFCVFGCLENVGKE
jgi:hypothetical protein